MALPVWAIYMQKIYNDRTLKISKDDFDPPMQPLTVNLNCDEGKKMDEAEKEKLLQDEF